jgi:hypothetical protein
MDALYFRVSSDRQISENQFDELIAAARAGDPDRDWNRIRSELGHSVIAQTRTTRRGATRRVYQVDEAIARRLADQCIYLEQGKSGAAGKRRPLFDRMRKDAALRKFERVLVWKVTRLGRDMPRCDHHRVRAGGPRHHDCSSQVPDRARQRGYGTAAMGYSRLVRLDGKRGALRERKGGPGARPGAGQGNRSSAGDRRYHGQKNRWI